MKTPAAKRKGGRRAGFIRRMLSEKDGTPSSKRVAFVAVIFACIAFCGLHVIAHRGLDAVAVDLAKSLLVASAPTYLAGRYLENKQGEQQQATQPTPPPPATS